jgi:hypothetical protein
MGATDCQAPVADDGQHSDTSVGQAQIARAREELVKLRSAGTPHTAGYARDEFGEPWTDVDRNGCDTRNDILSRDLDKTSLAGKCVVVSGVLQDPYTGRTVQFRRGPRSAQVQIDHMYPLHRAWVYGAWAWTEQRRVRFANDRGNLLAVDGRANSAKGDSGPGEWRPANRSYGCAYATGYIDIARIYKLPVTPGDRRALTRMLAACPKRAEM